jgi:hypothetical protein
MPGITPPTSQLDWLISTTAMIVLSWSKATRDLLKSFGWGIRALHLLPAATMVPSPRRLPHTISPLVEGVWSEPVSDLFFGLNEFLRASNASNASNARRSSKPYRFSGHCQVKQP